MTAHDDLLHAAALAQAEHPGELEYLFAEKMLAAAEPIIRAAERERLRAQVARLDLLDIREDGVRGTTLVVRLDDVEALLGGESDE